MPSLNRASILVADDRASGRYRLLLEAQAGPAESGGSSVTLHDLSQDGLLFEAEPGIAGGAEIMLDIPGAGPVAAEVVWTNGGFYGAQFARPLTPDRLKAALSESKVVWPQFVPPPPVDIEQARSRQAAAPVEKPREQAPQAWTGVARAVDEEAKLPLPVRIRIIVGLTLAHWGAIFGLALLAF